LVLHSTKMRNTSEHIIEKDLPHGNMQGVMWDCDGITIGYGTSLFTKKSAFTSISSNDMVRLHFGTKGDYEFTHKQLGQSFDLIGGHHNLMYSQEFEMTVLNKTLEIETFGVNLPKDAFIKYTENTNDHLKRFAEKIIEGKSVILSNKWGSINSNMEKVLMDIKNNNYIGEIQKAFLLSKSIELLVLSTESCISELNTTNEFIIAKRDKEKILAARDYINERINSPPNLSEVSKAIGLNEYKLKLGFKETFKTTLFGYLTEQRLHLAHQLLLDTTKTAAEISTELGYATPQHFNTAFKKKFEVTPAQAKK
jgi:AraC family transcriptional regulator, transcriptional activator of the genes for pyochelin and ferripyochelin receptors